MKIPKTGVGSRKLQTQSVTDAWDELFRQNAALEKKRGGKPLTDDQLIAEMKKRFPLKAKEGRTTIVRVKMMRGCYNRGSGPWVARYLNEVADGKNRPQSFAYDGDGKRIDPRSTSSVASKEQKKAAAKAKAEKEKTGKKKKKKTGKKKAAKKKAVKKKAKAKAKAKPKAEAKPKKKKKRRIRRRRRKADSAAS